jgi:hypothetical protein
MTRSQLGTTMPLKEREESIPSLLTDAYTSPLRAQASAAKRGRAPHTGEAQRRRASIAGVVKGREIDRTREVPCRPLQLPKVPRRR